MTDEDTIMVPRRTGAGRNELVAIYENHEAKDAEGKPLPLPADIQLARRVPQAAASEIGLKHGQALRVSQRVITHLDDGRLARKALLEGRESEQATGYVDPMDLLQAVIDETLESSNFGIHPKATNRVLVADMDAPSFAWWLYSWLGAKAVLERLKGASEGPLGRGPSASPGATSGTGSSRTG